MSESPHLQHQLSHLELLLEALTGRDRFVVEQAQQVVPPQGLLVVTLVDVQHPVLPIKVGELQTFLSPTEANQIEAEAGQEGEPDLLHHSSDCGGGLISSKSII